MSKGKSIEIFAAGTHTAMDGSSIAFGEAELKTAAAAYDPQLWQAPIVVGHPKTDDPAYGWVAGLAFAEGKLSAEPDQVDPAFAELVAAGRFKKVSACFFRPDAANNPVPGAFYLKHLGFLGAAAPAVQGLKPVAAFAGAEAELAVVELAMPETPAVGGGTAAFAWSEELVGRILVGIRELLVAQYGVDLVDKYVTRWDTTEAVAAAARQPALGPAFAAPPAAEAAAERQCLAEERAALERDRAAFAEERRTARRQQAEATVETLVAQGKVAPGRRASTVAFLAAAGEREEQVAIEGGQSRSFAELAAELLTAQPPAVDFSERSPARHGTEAPLDTSDPKAIAAAAAAFQASERGAGREVSIDVAVRHVTRPQGA